MNEKTVLKQSIKVFLVGLVIFSLVTLGTQDIAHAFGYVLGYLASVIVFGLIIKMSELILDIGQSTIIVVVMFVLKMLIYALSILAAIFIPKVFSLIGVFFGLMITRVTIFVEAYLHRGGEVSD